MRSTRMNAAVVLALASAPLFAADSAAVVVSTTYLCDNDRIITAVADYSDAEHPKITVSVDGDAALQKLEMQYVMSANGEKASNGKLVWWTKGDEGFLANEDPPAGDGEVVIGGCREAPAKR